MILALLLLTAPAVEQPYSCALNDTSCWQKAALNQEERAERAESKLKLQIEARSIVEKMAEDSESRAQMWRKTSEAIAPKPLAFYEQPLFWMSVGFVAGAATSIAVVYAVVPARSQ